MKILHFDFDDLESPTAGGQAVRNFEINRRLVLYGHEVTMITMNYANAKNKVKEGIHYKRVGLKKNLVNFISYWCAVPFLIRKYNADIIVEDNMPPFTFGFSPLHTKKPVVSQIQTFGAKFTSQKYKLPFWRIEKSAIKLYKNFIVLTKNIEQKILAENPSAHIKIIPNGINTISQANEKDTAGNILFLGRIDFFAKGLNYLLDTMKILQKKNPEIKLTIAGKGRDEKKLVETIKKEKLTNITYIGEINGEAKEDMLASCSMLVQPSLHENFPLTFLEAAAHGKPIVCFDIENVNEIMKANIGIMTPMSNAEKFAEAIEELHHNKTKRLLLGENAHAWAKKHLWDTLAKEQEKFYLECL